MQKNGLGVNDYDEVCKQHDARADVSSGRSSIN